MAERPPNFSPHLAAVEAASAAIMGIGGELGASASEPHGVPWGCCGSPAPLLLVRAYTHPTRACLPACPLQSTSASSR